MGIRIGYDDILRIYSFEKDLVVSLPKLIEYITDPGARSNLRRQIYKLNQHLLELQSLADNLSGQSIDGNKMLTPSASRLIENRHLSSPKKIGSYKVGGLHTVLFAFRLSRARSY